MERENKSDQSYEHDRLTVPSSPPVSGRRQRRSKWASLFDECRVEPGVWRRTVESFESTTAAQIASDIRNSWRRDPRKMRLRGLREGERWEAVWGPSPDGADAERCVIWLRYLGDGTGVAGPTSSLSGVEPQGEVECAW